MTTMFRYAAFGLSFVLAAGLLTPALAADQTASPVNRNQDVEVSSVTVEGSNAAQATRSIPGRIVYLGRLTPCDTLEVRDNCDVLEDLAAILHNGYLLYEKGDYQGALKEFNNVAWTWGQNTVSLSQDVESLPATLTGLLGQPEGAKLLGFAGHATQLTREAALMNAEIYLNTTDKLADSDRALLWLKRAARSGTLRRRPVFHADRPYTFTSMPQIAAVWLATLYRQGDKVERNLVLSRAWYERAAKLGYVPAYKALGDIYAIGLGVQQDGRKAAAYYQKAANYGFAPAQTALASLYDAGAAGLAADKGKALALYQQASNSDADAIYTLALAYEAGDGVTADASRAVELYRKAAEIGDRRAQAAYGLHLYEGTGVARDHIQARRWLEQAAAAGEPEGIYNLAVMMARGEGGPQDLTKAWVLFTFSGIGGQSQASTAIAALERRMTPAERASAASMLPPGTSSPRG